MEMYEEQTDTHSSLSIETESIGRCLYDYYEATCFDIATKSRSFLRELGTKLLLYVTPLMDPLQLQS
jgi:hypothetical protein